VFSHLKARRPGAPQLGTTQDRPARPARFGASARAVRPLGFVAVAAAAAIAVAGCKPGVYTSSPSGSGSQSGMSSSALSLAALQALTDKGKLQPGQAVFIHGCLGGVGRAAAQLAALRGASVAGSCRSTATHDANVLGIAPIVEFDFEPTSLRGRFDIVFDTAGTLPLKTARTLLRPGGHIIDINPTPAKLARGALPGPYQVLMTKPNPADLEELARAAGRGKLQLPIGRSVPLTEAIEALTALETNRTPKGGKLIITTA